MKKKLLITDKFRKSRGGYSRLINIFCDSCGKQICEYQKDGKGPIKRMYVDRIQKATRFVWGNNKKFLCPKCGKWLGIGSKYEKENRSCIILFQSVINKKVKKS